MRNRVNGIVFGLIASTIFVWLAAKPNNAADYENPASYRPQNVVPIDLKKSNTQGKTLPPPRFRSPTDDAPQNVQPDVKEVVKKTEEINKAAATGTSLVPNCTITPAPSVGVRPSEGKPAFDDATPAGQFSRRYDEIENVLAQNRPACQSAYNAIVRNLDVKGACTKRQPKTNRIDVLLWNIADHQEPLPSGGSVEVGCEVRCICEPNQERCPYLPEPTFRGPGAGVKRQNTKDLRALDINYLIAEHDANAGSGRTPIAAKACYLQTPSSDVIARQCTGGRASTFIAALPVSFVGEASGAGLEFPCGFDCPCAGANGFCQARMDWPKAETPVPVGRNPKWEAAGGKVDAKQWLVNRGYVYDQGVAKPSALDHPDVAEEKGKASRPLPVAFSLSELGGAAIVATPSHVEVAARATSVTSGSAAAKAGAAAAGAAGKAGAAAAGAMAKAGAEGASAKAGAATAGGKIAIAKVSAQAPAMMATHTSAATDTATADADAKAKADAKARAKAEAQARKLALQAKLARVAQAKTKATPKAKSKSVAQPAVATENPAPQTKDEDTLVRETGAFKVYARSMKSPATRVVLAASPTRPEEFDRNAAIEEACGDESPHRKWIDTGIEAGDDLAKKDRMLDLEAKNGKIRCGFWWTGKDWRLDSVVCLKSGASAPKICREKK